jgi:hypothetical protein
MKFGFAALIALSCAYSSMAAGQQPPIPSEELPAGAEVQTRGPVHEAFDEPVTLQAQAGVVAPHEPPANIDEVPPGDRPQGAGYAWVPGYWGWDADRNDFVWISACWRVAPPNMDWVPGYWTPVTGGWEWVPGFWSPERAQAINYLPEPPAPEDTEAPGPPPYSEGVWVPGCWYWQQDRYVHRAGYWLRGQSGWVWVPSHYQWTPRGYVFLQGHWDYALDRRGVLFAPVYFPAAAYARAGFSYTPTIAIDLGLLVVNLFAYPRYGHYYFGDYYDDAYVRVGIFPRFDCDRIHTWYDPAYQYDRWRHSRTDTHWEEHQRQDYDRRRADVAIRPPRTYRDMETRMVKLDEPQRRAIQVAGPMKTIVRRQAAPPKFEPIDTQQRQKLARNGPDVSRFRDQRAKWEGPASPHNAPVAQLPENRTPAPPPPQLPQNRTPAPPGEARGRKAPDEHGPPMVAPRAVPPTRPERVAIPTSPIAANPNRANGPAQKVPQPPPGERKRQAEQSKGNSKKNPKEDKQ